MSTTAYVQRWSDHSGEADQTSHRVLLTLGIAAFTACFHWAYANWVSPLYSYYGFGYNPPATQYLVLAYTLSVMPAIWMPFTVRRPSQLAYWVLYLTVIIPSMFIPLCTGLSAPSDVVWLMLTLFVGFGLTGTSYLLPLFHVRPTNVRKPLFWSSFGLMAVVFTIWVGVAFRNNMHLVGFGDIYDLREAADDVLAGTWLSYPMRWLYGAINPFLIGWGIYYRKRLLFLAGVLGQLMVYSSFGNKASILSIAFALAFAALLRKGRLPFALKLTWSLVGMFACLFLLGILLGDESDLLRFATFLTFGRTFGLPGLLTGQYYHFVQHNPLTYYSHLKIFSWFIHYPYQHLLGTEVGYYFYDPLVDATAHFWATDGIAALGLPGIPLISLFCALVFWVLDSLTQKHDPRLPAIIICFATFSLANLSIFTTLLSGGLALLVALLYFAPCEPMRAEV